LSFHTQISMDEAILLGQPGDLLVDCDGVLLNWLAGFMRHARENSGRNLDPAGPNSFNLRDWLQAESDQQVQDMIMDFNMGACGSFGRLPALDGAVDALQAVHKAGRGIHVITACSNTPDVVQMRRQNLLEVFGDIFSSLLCVDLHEGKGSHLARFQGGIWVEDNYQNAIDGAREGHQAFVLRAPYNKIHEEDDHEHPVIFVDRWADIIPHL